MDIWRRIKYYFRDWDLQKTLYVAFILLFIYIGYVVLKETADQPIKNGFIKNLDAVPIEKQEEMELNELNKAGEEDKRYVNNQTLSTLMFCINTAKQNDNYDCIKNLLDENVRSQFLGEGSENEGEDIYNQLIGERLLTGIEKEVIQEQYQKSIYIIWFLFLDGSKDNYLIEIEKGIITNLEGRV